MAELWSSGWLTLAILGFTLAEVAALWLFHRWSGRGLPAGEYALNLMAGLCLMAATHAVLVGAAWPWAVACMTLAGGAHGADLWLRWRRRSRA